MLYFVMVSQDCEDSNPLIRALAVRTMGCIRVDKITEYLCEPLRKCLKVSNHYSVLVKYYLNVLAIIKFHNTTLVKCSTDYRYM